MHTYMVTHVTHIHSRLYATSAFTLMVWLDSYNTYTLYTIKCFLYALLKKKVSNAGIKDALLIILYYEDSLQLQLWATSKVLTIVIRFSLWGTVSNILLVIYRMGCTCWPHLAAILSKKIFWKLDAFHTMEMNIDTIKIKSIANSPDPTPGALRLLGHKACAAEAWGTAGSGNGGHITDITIGWLGGDVITASVLIFMYVILKIKNKRRWAPPSDRGTETSDLEDNNRLNKASQRIPLSREEWKLMARPALILHVNLNKNQTSFQWWDMAYEEWTRN